MRSYFQLAALAAFLIFLASPAQASILNGGFEANGGSFQNWVRSTDPATTIQTAAFGVGPTEGSYQALLLSGAGTGIASTVTTPIIEATLGLSPGTILAMGANNALQGSFIYQDITVSAGDELFFDWNFLTNESAPSVLYNDFAFFSVSGTVTSATMLADTYLVTGASSSAFSSETGFLTGSYLFTTGGTYRVGFGVMDDGDYKGISGLLVDNIRFSGNSNVPEPASMVMWSLLGLAGLVVYRRRVTK